MKSLEETVAGLRAIQTEARKHLSEGEHAACKGSCREDGLELIAEIDDDIRKLTSQGTA